MSTNSLSGSGNDLGSIKDLMSQNISSSKEMSELQQQFDKQMEQVEFASNIEASRHGFAKDLASKLAQA